MTILFNLGSDYAADDGSFMSFNVPVVDTKLQVKYYSYGYSIFINGMCHLFITG